MPGEKGADQVVVEIFVTKYALAMRTKQSAGNILVIVLVAHMLGVALNYGAAECAAKLPAKNTTKLPYLQWQVVEERKV